MAFLFLVVIAAVMIPTLLRLRVRRAKLRRVDREAEIAEIGDGSAAVRQLKTHVRRAFLPVQDAWSRGSIDGVAGYLTEAQAARLDREIERRAARGEANRLEDVVLEEAAIVQVQNNARGEAERFVSYVGWRARDWTEDTSTGKVIAGKASRRRRFEQLWSFARDDDRGWLLDGIEDGAAAATILARPPVG